MRITHEPSLQPIISFSPESRFYQKPAFLSSSGAVFRYLCLKESPAKKTIHKETAPPAHHPAPAATTRRPGRTHLARKRTDPHLRRRGRHTALRAQLQGSGRGAPRPARLRTQERPALLYHPAVGRAQQLRRDQGTRLRRNGHHPKPLQRTGRHPRTAGPHHDRPLPLL